MLEVSIVLSVVTTITLGSVLLNTLVTISKIVERIVVASSGPGVVELPTGVSSVVSDFLGSIRTGSSVGISSLSVNFGVVELGAIWFCISGWHFFFGSPLNPNGQKQKGLCAFVRHVAP